jgi:CBS domain containing-hemolysin-like protein
MYSISLFELRRRADAADAEAELVYPLRAQDETLFALILGSVVSVVALVVCVDGLVPGHGFISGLLTIAIATIVAGLTLEIVPRMLMQKSRLYVSALFAPYLDRYINFVRPASRWLMQTFAGKFVNDEDRSYSYDELLKILEGYDDEDTSHKEDIVMLKNALTYSEKLVSDVMTPESMIVAIDAKAALNLANLKKLHDSGHSRFPVYDESLDNTVGTLYIRNLIDHGKASKTARDAMEKRVFFVNENQPLDHVLHAFLSTKHHLFMVINQFSEVTGLITIEDILEEVMGREIVDEFDRYDDLRAVALLQAKQKRPKSAIIPPKKVDTKK